MAHRGPCIAVLRCICRRARTMAVDGEGKNSDAESDKTVRCPSAAVVSVSREASRVGVQVLQQGGTAVDAAVATAFALAVTYPSAGNIGGGGYMLVFPANGDEPSVVFDYRETAPAAATRDMFGAQRPRHSDAVGVPGTVRGMALAHPRFGRLPWKDLLAPAVRLAEDGFSSTRWPPN